MALASASSVAPWRRRWEASLKIERRFTRKGESPYQSLKFVRRTSEIKNLDGSTVFRLEGIDPE